MFETLFKKCTERKWECLLLFVIVACGVFLRTYHFSDWLLFEIDQTYDTRIVSEAVDNGVGNLPLLGPTAGGGRALRLGPAFYYMEYMSALVFGNTPTGHAMLILILSILAIPLFYIFSKKYFTIPLSLLLTAIFSLSVYLVLYGRFSWSPNVLPFLTLLSFYALLRSVSPSETKRDRWFLVATATIAITSQIHFNAFFTIPLIAVLFLLYKRPRFQLKTWLIALCIVAIVYSPMILSDINTHGENASFFLKKISKGGSPLNPFKGVLRKLSVDLNYTASGYLLVNTGIDHITGGRVKLYGFQNDANLPWRIFAIVLFAAELGILLWNIIKEKTTTRRDFLVLLFLWVFIPFVYFYSLVSSNFQIYPRFYLLVAPAGIVLFGILIEKLQPKAHTLRNSFLILIALALLIPNITRIRQHFIILAEPEKNPLATEREDVFPNNSRLTQKEQIEITQYMLEKQKSNHYPIYLDTFHEYESVFWYHLSKHNVSYLSGIDYKYLYAEGNYFVIKYPQDGTQKAQAVFSLLDKKNFGALTVYTFTPKQEHIKAQRQDPNNGKQLEQTMQIQELKTWNDLF